jgi:YHS domain-containing protein
MRLSAILAILLAVPLAAEPTKITPAREALKPLNILVGSWKGTGTPDGTAEERQKGHWVETVTWEWQFKGDDAWLTVEFDKGKYFTRGELRHDAEKKNLSLKLMTVDKQTQTYTGTLNGKQLVFERPLTEAKQIERMTFSLLHDNRITYRLETGSESGTLFTRKYLVGMTKEGVAFADVGKPERECIVSGGTGTIAVSYEGKTYYVCCSGCRDEFKANPAKYVAEWETKRKK